VLVVDDESDFASALTARLSARGFDAHFVSSGEEALQTLPERPIDVVILDLKMPGMGGLEALRRIRASFPSVKVIVLTGHGKVDSGIDGMRAGATDFLLKPVAIETLCTAIEATVENGRKGGD
jgi:DNA-binding response OmpR family regulator